MLFRSYINKNERGAHSSYLHVYAQIWFCVHKLLGAIRFIDIIDMVHIVEESTCCSFTDKKFLGFLSGVLQELKQAGLATILLLHFKDWSVLDILSQQEDIQV